MNDYLGRFVRLLIAIQDIMKLLVSHSTTPTVQSGGNMNIEGRARQIPQLPNSSRYGPEESLQES